MIIKNMKSPSSSYIQQSGTIFQLFTIIILIYLILNGYFIAILLLIMGITVDFVIPLSRRSSVIISASIKFFLFIQTVIIWWLLTNNQSAKITENNGPYIRSSSSIITTSSSHFSPSSSSSDRLRRLNRKESLGSTRSSTLNPRNLNIHSLSSSSPIPFINTEKVLEAYHLDALTLSMFLRLFETRENFPPPVNFPDLRSRTSFEVRNQLQRVFSELPSEGFLTKYRSPCWFRPQHESVESDPRLSCLPYAYILGQPKCGTTDLFERLRRHPDIAAPIRKEIRWFTRGEFTDQTLSLEGTLDSGGKREQRLGPFSTIYGFTRHFGTHLNMIRDRPADIITIDGGPHTLWWPTQQPNGSLVPEDIPPAQILREMQPNGRFIITLADPVRRTYSDYYFLNDDRSVAGRRHLSGKEDVKSQKQFLERVQIQVKEFNECVERELINLPPPPSLNRVESMSGSWFRACQICAHDRYTFGRAGWGRINIGLYILFIEKWFEHFSANQFLVLRLEDFDNDQRGYLQRVLTFLGLRDLSENEWMKVLQDDHYNQYPVPRESISAEAEVILRNFFQPFNDLLATFLNDNKFSWRDQPPLYNRSITNSVSSGHSSIVFDVLDWKPPIPNIEDVLTGKQLAVYRLHEKQRKRREEIQRERGEEEEGEEDGEGDKKSNIRSGALDIPNIIPEPTVYFTPATFDIEDLPRGRTTEVIDWLLKHINLKKPPSTIGEAGRQLAISIMALDIPAIKHFLYDVGVPGNTNYVDDNHRPPFVTLASLATMSDGHSKSMVFKILKGQPSWLSIYMNPPIPIPQHSVHAKDIVDGLEEAVRNVTKWLIRAGADPTATDDKGFSALEVAAHGGLLGLVRDLLDNGALVNINSQNREGLRTPLHWALAGGRAEIGRELVQRGANMFLKDAWNVSAYDILAAPGPISAQDALEMFNVTQRPLRTIDRVLHPEELKDITDPEVANNISNAALHEFYRGWPTGTGGWGPERLPGFEEDMHCDIDQYWADEITGEEIFHQYIARNAPILIRGLIHRWDALNKFTLQELNRTHGKSSVLVSDIPYYQKFGGAGAENMLLEEYIREVREHRVVGGQHPWYVFLGHSIPSSSDNNSSFVPIADCPTPASLQFAFERMLPAASRGLSGVSARSVFVNAQWAFGGEGTGAPVHYHNTAWNALVYGAKKWLLYPPQHQVMSNRQISHFLETDALAFQMRTDGRAFTPITCVQTAGDVMLVPESWGHGVLNIQESLAVATEARAAHWRIKPGSRLITFLPGDNPPVGRFPRPQP